MGDDLKFPRSVGTNISKTAALVKCSRKAAIKEWIPKQKIGSKRQICSHHMLLKTRLERRIAKAVQCKRTVTEQQPYFKLQGILITE
ncbi:hypothetical protein TNCV_1863531 [Trichonephila clavipes]|nr:hypothetical protein TNCV_1863531 [Trichonephila clavipes]